MGIRQAIATSAALGLPLSFAAAFGYLILSAPSNDQLPDAIASSSLVGWVYLPGVLIMACTSMIFASLGAISAHRLPVGLLKKIFAILLLILSVKILFSLLA
jgi:uncharacterized membrane protein YfcA